MNPHEPTQNYLTMAIQVIEQHGGTKNPEATARAVWYVKMSAKQRLKWHRNRAFSLSSAERAYLRTETWAWRIAAAASTEHGSMDPEKIALGAAAIAGFLAPDVAQHIGAGVGNAWADFWASIGSGFGLGPGRNPPQPGQGGAYGEPTVNTPLGPYSPLTGLIPAELVRDPSTQGLANFIARKILGQ